MQDWENIILAIGALILVYFLFPNIKQRIAASKDAPKDWMGLLIPIGFVVLFIIFLITTL